VAATLTAWTPSLAHVRPDAMRLRRVVAASCDIRRESERLRDEATALVAASKESREPKHYWTRFEGITLVEVATD